jgi:hypothetical protein
MFIKLFLPFIVLINYFTIFYICYADKEYTSIREYPAFFSQYFLLGISSLLHSIKVYKYRIRLNLKLYYFFQISFLLYTNISTFALSNYIYGITTLTIPYILYLSEVGVLSLTHLVILYIVYKEERDVLPFHQI